MSSLTPLARVNSAYVSSVGPLTRRLPRTRSVSVIDSELRPDELRHKRSFGAVGEQIRTPIRKPSVKVKRRDHPLAYACWLLHMGLVVGIGILLAYSTYVLVVSKFHDQGFGPRILLTRKRHTSYPEIIPLQTDAKTNMTLPDLSLLVTSTEAPEDDSSREDALEFMDVETAEKTHEDTASEDAEADLVSLDSLLEDEEDLEDAGIYEEEENVDANTNMDGHTSKDGDEFEEDVPIRSEL